MNKKTFFITGGGTGGHIYPAIAVADELLKDENTEKIFYIGNPKNLEAEIVKDKDYTFLPVNSSGMPRKASLEILKWGFQMFIGWIKCIYYIKKYHPNAIFGTGGYVSAPILFAATTLKTPFVMHDCDANPGLVTRKFAPFAKSISIAFDVEKEKLNNNNCHVNGNPIRKEFSTLSKEQARKSLNLKNKLTLCIMGGSQGAKRINDAAVQIIQELSTKMDLQIIFQTGKRNYNDTVEKLKEYYPNFNKDSNIIIKPYFNNMAEVLKSCDIAVSRAGSLSISELCASSVAAIYIPYAYAAADHQRKNARYMVEKNAGIYLEDADTTPQNLKSAILSLVENKELLTELQNNANNMATYDGVERIINQIKSATS